MRTNFLLLSFALIFFITGCDEKKEVQGEKKEEKKKTETVQEKSDPVTTEEETTKNTADTAKTENNEIDKLNELGMKPGWPSDFPADIAKPKNSKIIGSLKSSEGTIVTFESSDKVPEIVSYYKDEMKKNGFTISEDGEKITGDIGGLVSWKKEKSEVNLNIAFDKEKNITQVLITYR